MNRRSRLLRSQPGNQPLVASDELDVTDAGCLADLAEFDEVDASLAGLDAAHEALVLPEAFSEFDLPWCRSVDRLFLWWRQSPLHAADRLRVILARCVV